jgi:hypothetical protein
VRNPSHLIPPDTDDPCKAHRTSTTYTLSNVQQSTALPMSCQVSRPTPSLIPSLAKSNNIVTSWSKDPRKRNRSVHTLQQIHSPTKVETHTAQDSPSAETNLTIQEMSAHPLQSSPLPNASSTASSQPQGRLRCHLRPQRFLPKHQ